MQVDGLRYQEFVPPSCPAIVIHNIHDAVVPVTDSRAHETVYANQGHLIEVSAGNDLDGLLDLDWAQVQGFLLGV